MLTTLIVVAAVTHVAAAVAAAWHLLANYRRPAAAVAWLFALFVLPLVGPAAYLMLAIYGGPRRVRRRRKAARALRSARRFASGDEPGYTEAHRAAGLDRLMDRVSPFPLTGGNAIELIHDGDDALRRQLEAIAGAEHEVLLETFVLKPGRVLELVRDALADCVARGVEVKLLFDPIGSSSLPRTAIATIAARSIPHAKFLAPNPLKGHFQVNFRNHRKILCVDGRVGFTGGRNWADEYYPEQGGPDAFRDTSVELRGPVVPAMRRVFLEDWAVATGDEAPLEQPIEAGAPAGTMLARVQPFGPDEPQSSLIDALGGALRAARESVFVATPYFVPGRTLQHLLRAAALSGVAVDLLLPERCDHRSIDFAARYYLEPLLEAGVRVFRRAPPLLHAKAVIVDGVWSTIGSVNVDARSLNLNYEMNVEVLSADFARDLRAWFDADLEQASELTLEVFRRRGRWPRVVEKAAALFEPLM